MLPSQQITPDWLLAVARRRWWLLALPLLVGGIGTAIYAQTLPNRYRSEAIILVTPPTLPSSYVRPTVTLPLVERLRILQQEVLSRSRLERIILDLDLYRQEREAGIMEDVVTQMRSKDISVSAPRAGARRNSNAASFVVGFSSSNARVAHQVAERLTSLFVDENTRQRETIAEGTDQFLTAEVDSARLRLEETEGKLEAYKRQYGGQLPDQLQSNFGALQNAQVQAQSLNESLNRDRSEQIAIERQINDLTGAATGGDETVEAAPPPNPYADALAKARGALDGLLLRLTPDHPDVVRQQRVVAELEQRARDAELRRPLSPQTQVAATTPAQRSRANQLQELRRRFEQVSAQIASKQRQIEARQAQAAVYQSRVDAAPAREAELIGLMRDYETLKNRYNLLLTRSEEAKVAANMERRQVSEQFRIVEPPRVPERPVSPDRTRMTMLGAFAGAGLGLLVIGLLEYRDRRFRTEDDVVAALALPVVAVVPLLLSHAERKAQWKRRWMLSG
ncbi:MAG TPA: hypothetical protein VMF13_06195, partial [Luteitalea sp.]|nr:hypothetical protein [Luteitalea sp.]